MNHVVCFTYNPFRENTYVVYDETKECIIFDPGCYTKQERKDFISHIKKLELKPVRLINTHCHIDHVLGNAFVAEQYNLELEIHKGEQVVLDYVPVVCDMYGIPLMEELLQPSRYIEEGELIKFGNTTLKAIFTPGHSPASLSFFCEQGQFLIAGDVLFKQSIGRTDLPGGDFDTLIANIKNKLFTLGDKVIVYPGHGESTTIGYEKVNNPFL